MANLLRIEIWHDANNNTGNVFVASADNEVKVMDWFHEHHPYSQSHALLHEGYSLRYVYDEPVDQTLQRAEAKLVLLESLLTDAYNTFDSIGRDLGDDFSSMSEEEMDDNYLVGVAETIDETAYKLAAHLGKKYRPILEPEDS
jgi:hypothetical protein